MDDVDEDDAHDPSNSHHRRHKPPIRSYSPSPQFPRTHHLRTHSDSESDDSDDRKIDQDSDEEEEENNSHSASSPESRGKRRKLDRFALGFEFAPRRPSHPLPPPPANSTVPSNSKSKNSPPDWSEDSTFVLLDAWGDLFVQNGRKSLRSDEWSEVAKKVNSHSPRIVRSDSQCRNRLDTLKKKYKKEKIRLAEFPDSKSDWIYFTKMDFLMSSPTSTPVATAAVPMGPMRLPCGVDAGEYVFSSSRVLNSRIYMNRASGMEEMRDSPGDTGSEDEDDDESDGLPPATMAGGKRKGGESLASFRILADSIRKFGEIYEKIEVSKRQQMVELERMRNEFQRDLEVQKRQILERAQAEIARMRQEEEEEEEGEGGRTDDGDDDGNGNGDAGVGGGDEDDDIDGSAENMSG